MRKYECLGRLALLATQFSQWAQLERKNESTRVQQSYVELRTQFAKWKETLSNHRRPDRFMITSKWIIVSLLEAIDQFITARLVNIALIKDLNSLDKDSLKHFSKLIYEYNVIVSSSIIINQISSYIKFAEWSHQRISNLLASEIAPSVSNALCTVFTDVGAEKDWNCVWKELVFYRDLVIVLYYSRAKLEQGQDANISGQVKSWSSKFMDSLLEQIQKELIDRKVTISVFRQNASLPKELLSMIARIDEHAQIAKNQQEFNSNFSRLTSSILKDSFLASSTTTSKLVSAFTIVDELSTKIQHNYIHNLNMCLSLAAIIPTRLDCFFQNGQLKPFFKVLFGELDIINKTIQNCWPNVEYAHNKVELERLEHPGRLVFGEVSIDYLNAVQESLTKSKDNNVLNYCDWISETMNDVLETAYPNAKYWKSSHPKHTDLSDQLIEQVIDPIEQSVIDFNPELQFAILQLLVNGVCDALLDYVKKTNYKYSIQGAQKLQSYCISVHDAIRDERHLHAKVVDQLGKLVSFKKLFTVCQILSLPIVPNPRKKNDYHVNMVAPSAGKTELDEKIITYDLDRQLWSKMRLKPSRFGRVLLCKE